VVHDLPVLRVYVFCVIIIFNSIPVTFDNVPFIFNLDWAKSWRFNSVVLVVVAVIVLASIVAVVLARLAHPPNGAWLAWSAWNAAISVFAVRIRSWGSSGGISYFNFAKDVISSVVATERIVHDSVCAAVGIGCSVSAAEAVSGSIVTAPGCSLFWGTITANRTWCFCRSRCSTWVARWWASTLAWHPLDTHLSAVARV